MGLEPFGHTVRINAATGPGVSSQNVLLTNVRRVDFQLGRATVEVAQDTQSGSHLKEFELSGISSIVFNIGVGGYDIVIG